MPHSSLQAEILATFQRNPGDSISEKMLHAVVVPDGGKVSRTDLHNACNTLIEAGELDYVRSSKNRRYRLAELGREC